MKRFTYTALLALVLSISAFTLIQSAIWKVQDKDYSVKFTSKKLDGSFNGLHATIQFDEADLVHSKISASIDVNSAETGIGLRNHHTKQALGSDKFPLITFESTAIIRKDNAYTAIGKLTLNGITKEILLPFSFTKTATGGVFSGKIPVSTKDYNISKFGSPDLVEVQLNIPVTK